MYPTVDFRSSLSLHQLKSVKLSKLFFLGISIVGKRHSYPINPLTYLRILLNCCQVRHLHSPHKSTHNTDTKRQFRSRIAQTAQGSNQPPILS